MSSTAALSNPELSPVAPAVVLDTNVVLDWLVFRHPCSGPLDLALRGGHVRWLASSSMRDELAHVLGRGVCDAWAPDSAAIWSAWDLLALPTEPKALLGAATRMRCTDSDDQKFIDLAVSHRVRWLLTRDRAVLKLGRRTGLLGVEVLTPERWMTSFKGDSSP